MFLNYLFIIVFLLFVFTLFLLYSNHKSWKRKIAYVIDVVAAEEARANSKEQELNRVSEELKKVKHQKKSSEVRTGLIAENALGFIKDLPYNFRNMSHLGNPIDYVYFDTEGENPEVVFIEVKSGNARETSRQKLIRNLVRDGKVRYELVRIDGSGVTIVKPE